MNGIRFSDDIVILANYIKALQSIITKSVGGMKEYGIKINMNKKI